MLNSGLSEAIGSCRIMAIALPRRRRISRALFLVRSVAVQADLAADDARGRRQQTDDREAGRGLAASGLADEAQRLALAQSKAHVLDRLDDPAAAEREVMRLQPADLEQWRTHAGHPR